MIRFGEGEQVVQLLAPIDKTTTTAYATPYVNIANAEWLTFIVSAGVITGDTLDITVESSSAGSSNASEAQVGFKYRLSGAVGTDTWGAITTAAAATGAPLTASDDNKLLMIDVDPAAVAANSVLHKYVRLVFAAGASVTAQVVGVCAFLKPRYAKNSPISSS